jgi:hypothetical protein
MGDRTTRGVRVFAAFLVLLGGATIATNLLGLVQYGIDSLPRGVLALAYGCAAVVCGATLWRGSHLARPSYLVWCLTIPLFMLTFQESWDPYLIPAYIGTIALLAWGYSVISRHTRRT